MPTITGYFISQLTNYGDSPLATDVLVLESSGNAVRKVTALDLLKPKQVSVTSNTSATMAYPRALYQLAQSGSDVAYTFTDVAVGTEIMAIALSVYGAGSGHQLVLPVGVTWDGTNRKAVFNAVGDSLLAVMISSTRAAVLSNNSVTFTN